MTHSPTIDDAPAVPPPEHRAAHPGIGWTLRVSSLVIALGVLIQPLWIGMFVTGRPDMMMPHSIGAGVITLATIGFGVAALLLWRPGHGDPSLAGMAAIMLVVIAAQATAGMTRTFALHFPLGVFMAVGAMQLVMRAWGLPLRERGETA